MVTIVTNDPEAEKFYTDSLKMLNRAKVPFLVGGTFAVNAYIDLKRPTKDLDIFCKPGDYPKILQIFSDAGYKTRVEDERWLAKVYSGKIFFDVVYSSANAATPVTDEWFKESQKAEIFGVEVALLPPTELIFSKVFIQERHRYDGSDVVHMMLKKSKAINWKRLFSYLDQYWEVLLIHVLNFRFIYPSEREIVPRWVVDELLTRLQSQVNLPTSKVKVCRGRMFSYSDYAIDITEWGFADLIGGQNERKK